MSLASFRPRVAEMRFQLLGRTVHPELFQTYKCYHIDRQRYSARCCITADGHYVTWRSGSVVLTEVAASATQPLPDSARLLDLPLRDQPERSLDNQGCRYRYEYHLERAPAEMFQMIHSQLGTVAHQHELIQVFNSSGRLPVGGLSFVHVECRMRVLRIQAIHTFPDDCVLVRTESSFTCPGEGD